MGAGTGTYLSGVHDLWPMHYPEYSHGYPQVQERIVAVPDPSLVELFVGPERFDVRTGELHAHERTLDLRAGTLRREAEWTSPDGARVRVRSERLVPLERPGLFAVDHRVQAVDESLEVEVRSAVVCSPQLHRSRTEAAGRGGVVRQRTDGSALAVAVLVDHDVTGPAETEVRTRATADRVVTTAHVRLEPGRELGVVKIAALGWEPQETRQHLLPRLRTALEAGLRDGFEHLAAQQREVLDDFWQHADVRVDGDEALQQAVRFALSHVLQAAAQATDRGIPATGLTGTGYDGHTSWDTEVFVMPMLNHVWPQAAAETLRWRHAMLPAARERAAELGLAGATYPWRTITGRESSGYWPAGTAAVHLNADIADAAVRYVHATGDEDAARELVTDVVVETARSWVVLGREDGSGRFHVDGVTGPDENSALVDDNACTNLMAQANLRAAFEHYEGLTVRDSSLSASVQAVVAAEVGHLGLAADYAREAVVVDLHDLRGKTSDGLHTASLAGSWQALVAGFGGMRDADGRLVFAPRLPEGLDGLCFRTRHRGSCLEVNLSRDGAVQHARYTVVSGGPVDTSHHGERFTVEPGAPRTFEVPPAPSLPRPPAAARARPARTAPAGALTPSRRPRLRGTRRRGTRVRELRVTPRRGAVAADRGQE